MKIKTNTHDLLVVTYRSTVISLCMIAATIGAGAIALAMFESGLPIGGVIGLLGAIICAIIFTATLRRVVVFLNRQTEQLTIRTRTWRGETSVDYPLHYLGEAVVQTQTGENGDTHRLALRLIDGMDKGDHPLTWVYIGDTKAHDAAHEINAWLMAPVDSLRSRL